MSAVGPTAARLRDPKAHRGRDRDETVEPHAKSQKSFWATSWIWITGIALRVQSPTPACRLQVTLKLRLFDSCCEVITPRRTFVNISQMTVAEMNVHETTTSPAQKQHWLAEQIFSWAGLPVVEVRPTVFLDGFFFRLSAHTVSTQNKLMLPFGRGKTSAVAAYDTARVMAAILADPSKHIGKIYHLTGPVSQERSC